MRVFVLCAGRTGSVTLNNGCDHIINFSNGHETNARKFGKGRIEYPDNHIEIDNRLIWFVGELEKNYVDKDTFWVHLVRDEIKTADSYLKRMHVRTSIVRAFAEGVYLTPFEKLNKDQQLQISLDYVRSTNANIRLFLSGKKNSMTMHLESIESDFKTFWNRIGAKGNLDEAIQSIKVKHNASGKKKIRGSFRYKVKLFLLRLKRGIF